MYIGCISVLCRCFDLTDDAFVGVAVQKLCKELTSLHLDGCYKLSDKTILEVSNHIYCQAFTSMQYILIFNGCKIGEQGNSPTRQLTDPGFETIHRQILRQLTDTL